MSLTLSASSRIVVLGTGGTIAGTSALPGDETGYVAGALPIADLLDGVALPPKVAIHLEQVAQIDSKDMTLSLWLELRARCVHWLAQDGIDGVVVTHGSDTLEETAFFLHATIKSSKPIVLTCAMRPATARSPDGPQNLRDAIAVACTDRASGLLVVCAGEVHCAMEVFKAHPYRLNAFSSGDSGPIGYVEEGQLRLVKSWPRDSRKYLKEGTELPSSPDEWPRVEIVMSHAGACGSMLDALLTRLDSARSPAVNGIVIAATGNGTVHFKLEEAAERAGSLGIAVVSATRCLGGPIVGSPPGRLRTERVLSAVKARIALMLELACSESKLPPLRRSDDKPLQQLLSKP